MKDSLEKRLGLLKGRVGGEAVTLHMPDGSTRRINGSTKHYFKLWHHGAAQYAAELTGEPVPVSAQLDLEIDWLNAAVKIDEPASMWNLMQVLLQGPNMDGQEEDEHEGTFHSG